MKKFLTLINILIYISCANQETHTHSIDNQINKKFILSDYYDTFKYHNITNFEIDSLPFEEGNHYYNQVDSTFLSLIFKKEIPMHEVWFYHATFEDTSLITLLQESDEYGPIIWLIKFDENGQYSDKTIIAMSSNDAGDTWQRYGVYNTDNSFTLTSIYKIWDKNKTKAANIDTTFTRIFLEQDRFKKIAIYHE